MEYLTIIGVCFMLFLPAWLLLLPMILLFERMSPLRGLFFICVGSIAAPFVLVRETIFFFNHARGNRFPEHSWLVREFAWVSGGAAILCVVYVLILRSARSRVPITLQPAR
jgi:hypothetical protein